MLLVIKMIFYVYGKTDNHLLAISFRIEVSGSLLRSKGNYGKAREFTFEVGHAGLRGARK